MGHGQDWIERFRRWFIPKLGQFVQLWNDIRRDNHYVTSTLPSNQFICRVPMGEEEFEKELVEMGFERNPLASLKTLASTGEVEEGSWRKVGYGGEDSDMQLHIILYDGNKMADAKTDYVYLYGHFELRWDTDPYGHYRAHDFRVEEGAKLMKDLLGQRGISYEVVRP